MTAVSVMSDRLQQVINAIGHHDGLTKNSFMLLQPIILIPQCLFDSVWYPIYYHLPHLNDHSITKVSVSRSGLGESSGVRDLAVAVACLS